MVQIQLWSESHHGDEAPNEAEVCEVVRVDGGGWVDLQTVIVLASILKQTVHGVQHLVGQQKEPLPAKQEKTSHDACLRPINLGDDIEDQVKQIFYSY